MFTRLSLSLLLIGETSAPVSTVRLGWCMRRKV